MDDTLDLCWSQIEVRQSRGIWDIWDMRCMANGLSAAFMWQFRQYGDLVIWEVCDYMPSLAFLPIQVWRQCCVFITGIQLVCIAGVQYNIF